MTEEMKNNHVWCVIPVYNNAMTIKNVVQDCKNYLSNILVVDDGSTDADLCELLESEDVIVLQHSVNMGKGQALITAMNYILEHGGIYMITIDGDGQHYAADIKNFLPVLKEDFDSVVIGVRDFSVENVPDKSKFGRSFSNFWLKLETGEKYLDSQSGFRAYPVKHISNFNLKRSSYDFEIEILVKASWAGLKLKHVDIDVHYPKPEERVTHFKPFMDNLRLSLLHARLVTRRLLPIPNKKLVAKEKEKRVRTLWHPVKLLRYLLGENVTPGALGVSAGIGSFLAVLPFVGCHMLVIIYVTTRLHLNRVMAVAVQNVFMPPLCPFLCIELGFFMRNGRFLTDFTFEAFRQYWRTMLWDWLLGSLVLAPVFGLIMGFIIFLVAKKVQAYDKKN